MIRVINPGLLTTIQDLGRLGLAHLGVSPAGAADSISFRIANLLLGNDANTPAFEMTLLGPTLEFETAALIAISGSRTSTSLPINEPFQVPAGTRITTGSLLDGARAYLAIRGGLAVPAIMNSCSTLLPGSIGGFKGRALKKGDEIALSKQKVGPICKLQLVGAARLQLRDGPMRVTATLQYDRFTQQAIERFQQQVFMVRDDSNRSGLRLQGEPIFPAQHRELLTEGIALGAVQIPRDGQPIILFIDQQTTGGYPKIANVVAADIWRVGQLRPRDEVRFSFVKIPEAIELLRRQEQALRAAFPP
jgi:antagonist of KipI